MNKRPILFVCSAIKNEELISKWIEAETFEVAQKLFEKDNGIIPQTILGPCYKKKTGILNSNTSLNFKPGQSKKGIYKDWNITAMILSNPINSACVFYEER